MTRTSRRLTLAVLAIAVAALALVVAACGSSTPSASPSGAPTVAPTASLPPPATTEPAPTPSATTSPSGSASNAICVVAPSDGQLPSDRLVDLKVSSNATADRVTFVFGDPSLPGPAGPPQGSLQEAEPPYTEGGSGLPIEVRGERVLQIRFSGMSIANDVGQEVYQGRREVASSLDALRHVVMYEAFEGVIGFYVGYDGPGCVELDRAGNDVTLTIQRP